MDDFVDSQSASRDDAVELHRYPPFSKWKCGHSRLSLEKSFSPRGSLKHEMSGYSTEQIGARKIARASENKWVLKNNAALKNASPFP
ncbi:unnamed protein product [Protopolystoma xenopodis]|uniref:Uncharacterized protein n=1 Tax=Protopolystoma xenopodis TaxID=117903 RepID=A0A448X2P9_9PLAT|nr:unnamed protein product [Protopolystoma xenopodis]